MVEVFMRPKHSKLVLLTLAAARFKGVSNTSCYMETDNRSRVRSSFVAAPDAASSGQTTVKGQLLVVSLGRRGYLTQLGNFRQGKFYLV